METKFPPTGSSKGKVETLAQLLDGKHLPQGAMPNNELRDLTRHAMAQIDRIVSDKMELTETEYDSFKLGAGIAYESMRRFEGMAEEMFGEIFGKATGLTRSHMMTDVMHAMTHEIQNLPERHQLIHLMISVYLGRKFTNNIDAGTANRMLEELRKGWKG